MVLGDLLRGVKFRLFACKVTSELERQRWTFALTMPSESYGMPPNDLRRPSVKRITLELRDYSVRRVTSTRTGSKSFAVRKKSAVPFPRFSGSGGLSDRKSHAVRKNRAVRKSRAARKSRAVPNKKKLRGSKQKKAARLQKKISCVFPKSEAVWFEKKRKLRGSKKRKSRAISKKKAARLKKKEEAARFQKKSCVMPKKSCVIVIRKPLGVVAIGSQIDYKSAPVIRAIARPVNSDSKKNCVAPSCAVNNFQKKGRVVPFQKKKRSGGSTKKNWRAP